MPVVHALQVDRALRTLEVVDIGGLAVLTSGIGHAWYEVGELGSEGEVRHSLGADAWQEVDNLRHPRHLCLPVEVNTPDGIARRLLAEVVLLSERFLVEVHHGGTQVEVGLELIVEVQTQHALGHHRERVVLARHAYRGAAAQDALVDDTHRTHGVVDGVVDILYERHTAGCHSHASRGHAITQRYLATHLRGEVAFEVELVLVGILLSEGAGHGVERVVAVLVGILAVAQQLAEVFTERLDQGEEDTTCGRLYDATVESSRVEPVHNSVGIVVLTGCVHTVETQELDEGHTLLRSVDEETRAHSAVSTLVYDVQAEVVAAYLSALQEVDVLHHKPPHRIAGIYGSTFQQLHHEGVRVVHTVGGHLTHLIDGGIADNLILEGDSQHLVVTQRLTERDESEVFVEGIFAAVKQAGTLYLLVVGGSRQSETLHIA